MTTLNIKGFPEELYRLLVELAKSEHRSLTQEVIYLLYQAVGKKEKGSVLKLRGLGKEYWDKIDIAEHIEKERDSWNF
jgi:hypothetical protein